MKANRKFLMQDEEAVSPVIAVILMVAITVVLAATVYVWVSGFSASGSDPAKTIALTSGGAYDDTNDVKKYVVASSSPGLKYSDFDVTIDGTKFTFGTCSGSNVWCAQAGATTRASSDVVKAGDIITIDCTCGASDTPATTMSGKALRVIDTNSNSVIQTLTVA